VGPRARASPSVRPSSFVRLLPIGAFTALTLLAPGRAGAASFDAEGNLVFDPNAVWTESFEAIADAGADAGDALDVEQDPTALHGTHLVKLAAYQNAGVDLPIPAESRSFALRLWARGEVVATLEVSVDGRTEDFAQAYPTGRMTSDGWYELASHDLTVDVSRAQGLSMGLFAPDGADVDAAELVPDGAPVFGAACTGADEKAACLPGQACVWGRCRNYASRVPAFPPDAWRDDLVDYIDQRFQLLFGPFANRAVDLPSARVEIGAMRSATDAWSFWRHFGIAVNRLHDWHTRVSDLSGYVMQNPHPIGVCFIEGKADLSQTVAPSKPGYNDVLVSHVGTTNTFGLLPGDRLVSIDGKHPIEWGRSLIGVDYAFETASNHTTQAEVTERLNRLISAYAETIEVLHCDPASAKCADKTDIVNIAALPPLPADATPGVVGCDNRPILHLADAPDNHPLGGFYSGIVEESNASERIYGLQWSSLNVTGAGGNGDVGPLLDAAVAEWRANARGVILDHRTGFGGTTLGSAIIWNFVRPVTPLDFFAFRQRADEVAPSAADGKTLFDELAGKGQVETAGSTNPALDVPVALLVTMDGSASDWLPLGVKGSPKAKIFGPFPTAGAFSTRFIFAYWFGLGYSIATGDTLGANGTMLNGYGVEPDVVVLPLQSDLLVGKDSVYDAAIAWVRSELKP
jgi:hypothetical protein